LFELEFTQYQVLQNSSTQTSTTSSLYITKTSSFRARTLLFLLIL